jgi:hypothetical protein
MSHPLQKQNLESWRIKIGELLRVSLVSAALNCMHEACYLLSACYRSTRFHALIITPLVHANILTLIAQPSDQSQHFVTRVVSLATLTVSVARPPGSDIPFL